MSRRKHPIRKIVVDGETFGWTAHGDDGHITLSIWRDPQRRGGLTLRVRFDYAGEVTPDPARRCWHMRQRRVISPGVVRRVIDAATKKHLRPGSGETRDVCLRSDEVGFPDGDDPFPPLDPSGVGGSD